MEGGGGSESDEIKLIANNVYYLKLANKVIRNFINKMKIGVNINKTDNEVVMKRVLMNYYPEFFEFIKTTKHLV